MSALFKNLIIALIVTMFIGAGYYFISGGGGNAAVGDVSMDSDISLKTEKVLSDIQKINTYKLDIAIFDDPRFTSLQDRRVRLVDVTTGRSNPFDPVR